MRIRVNPTRMQLVLIKRRLDLSKRGHKLLKDKLDGLVVEFLSAKKEFLESHDMLESPLRRVFQSAAAASALSLQKHLPASHEEISVPEITASYKNIMGISIPRYTLSYLEREPELLSGRSSEFFESARDFRKLLPDLVDFASRLEALLLLSKQIMETRRRVNALEYILIPELSKTARSIRMKLEEVERSSRTVLIKMSGKNDR